eukprot:gene1869-8287_t
MGAPVAVRVRHLSPYWFTRNGDRGRDGDIPALRPNF